jgi:hypothetical protein
VLQHESKNPKAVLIMDEVDGMSAGDRGGLPDLIAHQDIQDSYYLHL